MALLAFVLAFPAAASAGWLQPYNSWNYRNSFFISGSTAEQTNYPVEIPVSFASGQMNSDFSDIRFTSSDTVTTLNYWRESYALSTSATFWVQVPDILMTGTTVYMYYGNASAATASNGTATFSFFDDFTGTCLDPALWQIVGSPTLSTSCASGVMTVSNVTTDPTKLVAKTAPTGINYALRAKFQVTGGSGSDERAGLSIMNSTTDAKGFNYVFHDFAGYSETSFLDDLVSWYDRTGSWSMNTIYTEEIVSTGPSVAQARLNDGAWTAQTFTTNRNTYAAHPALNPGSSLANASGVVTQWDFAAVRKFVSPEPAPTLGPLQTWPNLNNPSISAVTAGSITVSFSPTGADGYEVDASTASDFSGTIYSSSTQSQVSALSPQNLAPNTTYYMRAGAVWGATTYYANATPISTATLANAPTSPGVSTFTAVYQTSATVCWGANGNPLNVTTYTVVLTTSSSYPNSYSGNVTLSTIPAGGLPTATVTGLSGDVLYYLFVGARNWGNASSGYTALGSAVTTGVAKTWVGGANTSWNNAANWSPVGVPQAGDSATIDASASVVASSGSISFASLTLGDSNGTYAANLFLSTGLATAGSVLINNKSGLTVSTTQQLVINGNFTMQSGSSMTATPASTQAGIDINIVLTGSGVFNLAQGSTVTLAGQGFSGGAARTAGSGYGPGGTTSSNNAGGGGGGHGGAGGAGSSGAAGVSNDTPTNPTYPGSGGGGGRTTAGGGTGGAGGGVFILSASSVAINGLLTVNGLPGQINAGAGGGGAGGSVNMTSVYFSGAGTVNASGGGGGSTNGGGGGGGDISINITGSGSMCNLSLSVAGGTSTATAGSTGVISSTITLAAPALTSVWASSSSIEWDWNGVTGGASYQIFSSTGGLGQSPILGAGATYYRESSLTPNTTYTRTIRVTASCGGLTANSAAFSTSTLAAAPVAAAKTFAVVNLSSMTVNWSANGNPVGVTTYTVVLSTGLSYPNSYPGNVSISTVAQSAAATATLTGLSASTTYYLYVAAISNSGSATSYTALGSAMTLANAPTFLNFTGISASGLTFNWTSNIGAGALYQVLTSTAANPSAPAGAVVITSNTYNTFLSSAGLNVNTTYYFRVAALTNGVPGVYSTAQGTSTLANAPSNPVFAAVLAGNITVNWTASSAGTAAGYLLQASTAANFTGTVYSSATTNAASGGLSLSGLWANTTYYFQVAGLNWNSVPTYQVWGGSTATLALPPSRLASDYLAVYYTSATLQWAALPQSPSSQTCEGYLLQASTAPDFSGTVFSSVTPNAALSTLTISGLNLANTYYFQVGSLNPESVWNPVSLTQLNMQLSQSTAALSLGALDPTVYFSTISISSFVVTNQGSLPVTLVVWASTMTQPSSPWTLGQAPANETVLLQGIWNSAAPSSGQFNTAIINSTTTSTSANYAGNQTGVSIPPGQTRTMWFQFWRPLSTITNAKQSIQISVQAVYP